MLDKNKPYNFYSNCILVKGVSRSCIYDLQLQKYYFIPNDLYNILSNKDFETITDVLVFFDAKHHNTILSYFDFLYEKKIIFFNKNKNFFTSLNTEYYSYSIIENVVIYFDFNLNYSSLYLSKIIELFNALNIVSVQLVLKNVNNDLFKILSLFENSNIVSIHLVFINNVDKEFVYELFKNNQRIFKIIVFSSQIDLYETVFDNRKILLSTLSFNQFFNKSLIDINTFTINLKYFIEALHYNTYFNKKMFIDENGNIHRFEKDDKSFGNVLSDDVKNLIKTSEYKFYMGAKKDLIDICKDCELRYMCYDTRVPKQQGDTWIYENECGYNPYIVKWKNEEGWQSVKLWRIDNPN